MTTDWQGVASCAASAGVKTLEQFRFACGAGLPVVIKVCSMHAIDTHMPT